MRRHLSQPCPRPSGRTLSIRHHTIHTRSSPGRAEARSVIPTTCRALCRGSRHDDLGKTPHVCGEPLQKVTNRQSQPPSAGPDSARPQLRKPRRSRNRDVHAHDIAPHLRDRVPVPGRSQPRQRRVATSARGFTVRAEKTRSWLGWLTVLSRRSVSAGLCRWLHLVEVSTHCVEARALPVSG